MNNVQQLLEEKGNTVFSSQLHIAPDIPEKNLNNAIKKFEYDGEPETIVMLFDNTISNNGKEGLLFSGTKLIYRATFSKPIHIEYEKIKDVRYKKERIDKENGKVKIEESVEILVKGSDEKIEMELLSDCNYKELASMIESIVALEGNYTESSQILPLQEMDEIIKLSYLKIIINMAYSDDGEVDSKEYAEILSLITRLDFTPEQRAILREYMSIDKDELDTVLDSTEELVALINDNIPEGNEHSIYISLVKDLINVYTSISNGEINNFHFLQKFKNLFGVNDEKIDFIAQANETDRSFFSDNSSDSTITNGIKELAAQAGSVGVPIAAIYMSGSAFGLSAAGMTSGLAALGLGGVLGFSSMATGIGVAVLLGVGAYKGIKYLTGSNELEKNKKRELMLQAVVKHTQKTINVLIEDVNYISVRLSDAISTGEVHALKILKLTQKLSLLSATGKNLSEKSGVFKLRVLRTRCPSILKPNRLKSLTSDPTKKKYFQIVISCYEEKQVKDEDDELKSVLAIKAKLTENQLENLVRILEAIGYFDLSTIGKGQAKSALGSAKSMFKKIADEVRESTD